MGQLLSEPVTTKNTSSIENKQFKVGSSAMQGWRVGILYTQRVHTRAHTHTQTGRECSKMSVMCETVRFHVCCARGPLVRCAIGKRASLFVHVHMFVCK